jgi:chromosome segregation ATPase
MSNDVSMALGDLKKVIGLAKNLITIENELTDIANIERLRHSRQAELNGVETQLKAAQDALAATHGKIDDVNRQAANIIEQAQAEAALKLKTADDARKTAYDTGEQIKSQAREDAAEILRVARIEERQVKSETDSLASQLEQLRSAVAQESLRLAQIRSEVEHLKARIGV